MAVTYPRDMRARADQDGKTLASFDSEADGCRVTSQGPATEAQARFALWCGVACSTLSERQLNDIRRDLKKRVERANRRRRSKEVSGG